MGLLNNYVKFVSTEGCGISQYPDAGEGLPAMEAMQQQPNMNLVSSLTTDTPEVVTTDKRENSTLQRHLSSAAIIGGIDAREGEFPWQVD